MDTPKELKRLSEQDRNENKSYGVFMKEQLGASANCMTWLLEQKYREFSFRNKGDAEILGREFPDCKIELVSESVRKFNTSVRKFEYETIQVYKIYLPEVIFLNWYRTLKKQNEQFTKDCKILFSPDTECIGGLNTIYLLLPGENQDKLIRACNKYLSANYGNSLNERVITDNTCKKNYKEISAQDFRYLLDALESEKEKEQTKSDQLQEKRKPRQGLQENQEQEKKLEEFRKEILNELYIPLNPEFEGVDIKISFDCSTQGEWMNRLKLTFEKYAQHVLCFTRDTNHSFTDSDSKNTDSRTESDSRDNAPFRDSVFCLISLELMDKTIRNMKENREKQRLRYEQMMQQSQIDKEKQQLDKQGNEQGEDNKNKYIRYIESKYAVKVIDLVFKKDKKIELHLENRTRGDKDGHDKIKGDFPEVSYFQLNDHYVIKIPASALDQKLPKEITENPNTFFNNPSLPPLDNQKKMEPDIKKLTEAVNQYFDSDSLYFSENHTKIHLINHLNNQGLIEKFLDGVAQYNKVVKHETVNNVMYCVLSTEIMEKILANVETVLERDAALTGWMNGQ